MKESEREQIALFRYNVISTLINNDISTSKNQLYQELSERKFRYIDGNMVKVSPASIERWYYTYTKKGFDALKPMNRNDIGKARKLDEDTMMAIVHYITEHPRIPATAIYEALISNGYIANKDVSLSTVSRFVSAYKKNKDISVVKEMRRYEAEHINDIWCCDTTYSFKLDVGGKKQRTYIIAILDDASRAIVGCDVFFQDNFVNFLSVLKGAVTRFGKPKKLNLDNGAPYKNNQIELLGARLGIIMHHNPAYSPTGKAKIERFFCTLKDHFMATYHLENHLSIEKFRKDLLEYINSYNNKIHSSLNGRTPYQRFFDGKDEVKYLTQEFIDKSFLLEIDRTVSADNVILIDQHEYEVPYKYARKRIKLRYSADLKDVYVIEDDKYIKISLLDKVANSKVKREKPKLTNMEE